MVSFHFQEIAGSLHEPSITKWLDAVALSEGFTIDNLSYIFCTDAYLLDMNKTYLNHDTYTDVITFDYVQGKEVSGDIFISQERLVENALSFGVTFEEERLRVMAHGLLHLLGYKDKTTENQLVMTNKENEKIKMFHVEP